MASGAKGHRFESCRARHQKTQSKKGNPLAKAGGFSYNKTSIQAAFYRTKPQNRAKRDTWNFASLCAGRRADWPPWPWGLALRRRRTPPTPRLGARKWLCGASGAVPGPFPNRLLIPSGGSSARKQDRNARNCPAFFWITWIASKVLPLTSSGAPWPQNPPSAQDALSGDGERPAAPE